MRLTLLSDDGSASIIAADVDKARPVAVSMVDGNAVLGLTRLCIVHVEEKLDLLVDDLQHEDGDRLAAPSACLDLAL
jgi:hypothetical protein